MHVVSSARGRAPTDLIHRRLSSSCFCLSSLASRTRRYISQLRQWKNARYSVAALASRYAPCSIYRAISPSDAATTSPIGGRRRTGIRSSLPNGVRHRTSRTIGPRTGARTN